MAGELDPQVRRLLESLAESGVPPVHELAPAAARQQMRDATAALGRPAPIASCEDRSVPGPGGGIPVRIYRPDEVPRPVVVYFHGGGWVMGDIETHDGYCRALANAAPAVVVSVDYRLAPEHPYPAAVEDASAATTWAAAEAHALGGDGQPVVVAGDSAGGNLASVVALLAREQGGPPIRRQVLIYPITDHAMDTESYGAYADGYFLTRDTMAWFWDQYCPSVDRRGQPTLSPLRAERLEGLPPALVITAEFDPLRDEGEAFAARLRGAGVDVTERRYDGMIHGFVRRLNQLDAAREALRQVAAAVAG